MRDLLAELTRCLDNGRELVWCSVVETRGSTPQKAGAAMLVFPDGGQTGTLGGGCVEAEVKRKALHLLGEPTARTEVLSFQLDDDYGWDDGLICGGRMTMLVAPMRTEDRGQRTEDRGRRTEVGDQKSEDRGQRAEDKDQRLGIDTQYYRAFREMVEAGRGCTEVVALANNAAGVAPGSRYLFDAASTLVAQLDVGDYSNEEPLPQPLPEAGRGENEPPLSASGRGWGSGSSPPRELLDHLKPLSARPRPSVQKGFAYVPVLPRITLLIVGGGHVGQAVAQLASQVDFDIWVLDDRDKYVSPDRFPTAQRRFVGDIGRTLQELAKEVHPGMYCLIVTRGHNHDEEALYHLCRTPAGYVGMIGSKRKIKLIFEDLIAKGISEDVLAKVHAPLGIPIGSQTVPEIAISIVAELVQQRNTGSVKPRLGGFAERSA